MDKKRKKRKMAAPRTEIKDFSAEEFADEVRTQCKENNGRVNLSYKQLTIESMARLAKGLLQLFLGSPGDDRDDDEEDDSPLTLTILQLGGNAFGDDGLGALAEALSRLSRCRETLEVFAINASRNVTTLAPLADAGVFEGLKKLNASGCYLSGDEGVLPPELCANLPALKELYLRSTKGGATITLTSEALCALPAECKVVLGGSKVQVLRPSAEDGEMGLVALPTKALYKEEFSAYNASSAKTVAEICAFAGVQRVTMVKPARRRGMGMGMRCGACSSPHPRFACAACKQETYCNERCQAKDWRLHQHMCKR